MNTVNDTGHAGTVRPEDFEELATSLRHELHVHCYRMLGSIHDADDAVQEALVRAWRALPTLDDRRGFRPWLYKIATNRCLTMIEARRRRELPMDLAPGAPATEVAWLEPYPGIAIENTRGPEAHYEAREAVELAFVGALQQLPGTQRAVLVLRDVLGFSARETAGLLEMGVAAANSALQRARVTVRRHLPQRSQQAELAALGDAGIRDLARRYAAAWEAGDVPAIVAMLDADAKYAMPPLPQWFRGHADIRAFLETGPAPYPWRFVATTANGQLAFGTYMWDSGAFTAAALDVVAVAGPRIVEVVSFLTPEIFGRFGLPAVLPRESVAPDR